MYKIVGTDGKIYGPANAEQIRRWLVGGRVESRTPVFVAGAAEWTFLGLLPEFAVNFVVTPPAIGPVQSAVPAAAAQSKTNSGATAGFVFGILSWVCCCGFPFSLLGLIFSLVALSQISASPQTQSGRGLAVAGLVLSVANLFFGLGWLVFSLATHPPAVTWQYNRF